MRLLLVNGNTDAAVTARLVSAARGMTEATSEGETARFGAPYIASRAAVAVAGHAVLDALYRRLGHGNPDGFDAALIACFGEPGLDAAREAFRIPILGMADASIGQALAVAPRVAVLTGGPAWVPMLTEFFMLRGLGAERVMVRAVPPAGDALARDPDAGARLLADAARAAVAEGAGAILLGGAGLVGFDARLAPLLPVPVLCGLRAALAAPLPPVPEGPAADLDALLSPPRAG